MKQFKAQKQAVEARDRAKQKEQDRKDDTRRKILRGSYLIKKMNANDANKENILAELNEYLTDDRSVVLVIVVLFGLIDTFNGSEHMELQT